MLTEILLVAGLLLLVTLVFLVLKGRRVEPAEIKNAISSTWTELGLGEKIGSIETHVRDVKESYRSFEQMLRVPQERASLGELSLETILSDQLPPDMYGIRETIFNGKRPDAHIRSTVGVICIDAKFSLDNYGRMITSEDSVEKQKFKREFLNDVKRCFDKIASDYICPGKGSAEFAFAYIPSESVYYFLVSEAFEMLRDYIKAGVQVVSPLTLSAKIELIKAGVHAKKLSEKAEAVRKDLARVAFQFTDIDDKWRVFYETHLRNAVAKSSELDEAYKKLREEFERISKIPED